MAADTPFTYWFTVDHVYDGDTCMGRLDMGLAHYLGGLPTIQAAHDTADYSLRLYGINAPEMNAQDPAVRADAFAARDNLGTLLPIGAYIKVVSMGWDKYSMRIDAIPYSPQGIDCCQAQLDGGFAVPYMV
jgi:endonuclease YncB( thermonuclease family)